jgi:hypothetical protein
MKKGIVSVRIAITWFRTSAECLAGKRPVLFAAKKWYGKAVIIIN